MIGYNERFRAAGPKRFSSRHENVRDFEKLATIIGPHRAKQSNKLQRNDFH